MRLKIAIQGIESSFHDLAVQQLFPETEIVLVPCKSFKEVTLVLEKGDVDMGVIAIENTIAGSILPNYQLIDDGNFKILGETFLTIDMYMMALDGQSIHDIDEVHSHPVALQQCSDYLQKLQPHCKIIEGKDTASVAKKIKELGLKNVAAIAGKQVAEKFGLTILERKIQTIKENKTRFVILGNNPKKTAEVNKASIRFELHHEIGSLSNVLQLLSTFGINLTKIQSFPIEGKPWQYAFFVDVLFTNRALFQEVVELLEKAVSTLKVLGVYQQNLENKPYSVTKEKELVYEALV